MKQIYALLAATALIAPLQAFAGAAGEAAAEPVVAAPAGATDWSGLYGGLFMGTSSGSYDFIESGVNPGLTVDVDGMIAGARLGYNWQAGSMVYGVDASISTGPEGITPQFTTGIDVSCITGDCNVSFDYLATIRGRVGATFGPGGNTMAYGAAGFASAGVEGGIINSGQQGSSTATGYTVAVGLEHAFNDKMSLFGEAAYFDLGDLGFGSGVFSSAPFEGAGDFNTLTIGVNFRF